jgi:hypothetical protein
MATCVNTFDFIPSSQRIMYETAFNAITQLELWGYMKNFKGESFMFSGGPEVDRVYKKIEDLGYGGHSGCSFGFTMRTMEFIAKYGIDKFEQDYRASIAAREQETEREQERIRRISNTMDTDAVQQ